MKSAWQTAIHRLALGLSGILAIAFVLALLSQQWAWIPPLLSGCAVSFALAAAGFFRLRKWAFTIWIAAAVIVGMCYSTWYYRRTFND